MELPVWHKNVPLPEFAARGTRRERYVDNLRRLARRYRSYGFDNLLFEKALRLKRRVENWVRGVNDSQFWPWEEWGTEQHKVATILALQYMAEALAYSQKTGAIIQDQYITHKLLSFYSAGFKMGYSLAAWEHRSSDPGRDVMTTGAVVAEEVGSQQRALEEAHSEILAGLVYLSQRETPAGFWDSLKQSVQQACHEVYRRVTA